MEHHRKSLRICKSCSSSEGTAVAFSGDSQLSNIPRVRGMLLESVSFHSLGALLTGL